MCDCEYCAICYNYMLEYAKQLSLHYHFYAIFIKRYIFIKCYDFAICMLYMCVNINFVLYAITTYVLEFSKIYTLKSIRTGTMPSLRSQVRVPT